MSTINEKLLQEVLSLPADLRALLIDKLLESLNLPLQEDVDALWAEEAERRVKEIQTGNVKPIPGEEVFKEIRKRLKK